jgi:hypothetical protein
MGVDTETEMRWAEEDSVGEDEQPYLGFPLRLPSNQQKNAELVADLFHMAVQAFDLKIKQGEHEEDAFAFAMSPLDVWAELQSTYVPRSPWK